MCKYKIGVRKIVSEIIIQIFLKVFLNYIKFVLNGALPFISFGYGSR